MKIKNKNINLSYILVLIIIDSSKYLLQINFYVKYVILKILAPKEIFI